MRQYQLQDYETTGATCPECGESFSGRSGLSKHHAAQHGSKFYPLGACDWCGKIYTETSSNLHTSNRHYCSESCRKQSHSNQRSGERNPLWKESVTKECQVCGDTFTVKPALESQKFCSGDCYHTRNREEGILAGRNNPQWKPPSDVECEICGELFEVHPYREDSARFCSWDCKSEWQTTLYGSRNPQWKGGVNWYRAIRASLGPVSWPRSRELCLEDNCEICGAESTGTRGLSLHHIVPVLAGGTNGEWNFMTLCEPCHSAAEACTNDLPGFGRILFE